MRHALVTTQEFRRVEQVTIFQRLARRLRLGASFGRFLQRSRHMTNDSSHVTFGKGENPRPLCLVRREYFCLNIPPCRASLHRSEMRRIVFRNSALSSACSASSSLLGFPCWPLLFRRTRWTGML